MHLGPTASFLANALNRPEPSVQMLRRLLRENDKIKKGPRGKNSSHVDSATLSTFVIALMCCPDSPAVALSRLDHFAELRLDTETNTDATFSQELAMLLDRLAGETWDEAKAKNWQVIVSVDMSSAMIEADPHDGSDAAPEEHFFNSMMDARHDHAAIELLPYYGGLEFQSSIRCSTLFRIAKVVLANEADPLTEILDATLKERGH